MNSSRERASMIADQHCFCGTNVQSAADGIRVVVAAELKLCREGLILILSGGTDIEVVGEATDWSQTLAKARDLKPDLLIIDRNIAGSRTKDMVKSLTEVSPESKVLILSPTLEESVVTNELKAGAKGYISKHMSGSELRKAVLAVHKGELWLERRLFTRLFEKRVCGHVRDEERPEDVTLTGREQEILDLVASGDTNKQIGKTLGISEKTVKSHLNSIFRKLNISRRVQTVAYASGFPLKTSFPNG